MKPVIYFYNFEPCQEVLNVFISSKTYSLFWSKQILFSLWLSKIPVDIARDAVHLLIRHNSNGCPYVLWIEDPFANIENLKKNAPIVHIEADFFAYVKKIFYTATLGDALFIAEPEIKIRAVAENLYSMFDIFLGNPNVSSNFLTPHFKEWLYKNNDMHFISSQPIFL